MPEHIVGRIFKLQLQDRSFMYHWMREDVTITGPLTTLARKARGFVNEQNSLGRVVVVIFEPEFHIRCLPSGELERYLGLDTQEQDIFWNAFQPIRGGDLI